MPKDGCEGPPSEYSHGIDAPDGPPTVLTMLITSDNQRETMSNVFAGQGAQPAHSAR